MNQRLLSPWWRVWLAPWRQSLRTPIIIIGLVKRFDQIYFCIELLYFFLKFFNFINLFLLFFKPSIYLQIYLTAGSSNSIILFASKGFHAFRWDESPEAEFKEFKPRFKFKPRLKFYLFHLNLYSVFRNLSRRSIEPSFSGF